MENLFHSPFCRRDSGQTIFFIGYGSDFMGEFLTFGIIFKSSLMLIFISLLIMSKKCNF